MAAETQSNITTPGITRHHDYSLPLNSQSALSVELSDLLAAPSTGNTDAAEPGRVDAVGGPTSLDSSLPSSSQDNNKPLPAAVTMANETSNEQTAPFTSEKPIDPLALSSTQTAPAEGAANADPSTSSTATNSAPPNPITRLDSEAIGPSQETMPQPVTNEAGPVLVITLLLTSGARHPYKIDEKYLAKRNVTVPGTTESGKKDPFSISVYTLKELILREWREEWEPQPSSPSSIRLIYFGHFLDDKASLKDSKLNANAANVVHMTVRPQDIVDEEDATKSKTMTRDRDGGEETAGCRCVIL